MRRHLSICHTAASFQCWCAFRKRRRWWCCRVRPRCSMLPIFRRPRAEASLFVRWWHGTSRRCSQRRNNPPHATPRVRSSHAWHAGCSSHCLCGGETLSMPQDTLAQLIGLRSNAISIVAHALQRRKTEPMQESAPLCHFILPTMRARLILQVVYRAWPDGIRDRLCSPEEGGSFGFGSSLTQRILV